MADRINRTGYAIVMPRALLFAMAFGMLAVTPDVSHAQSANCRNAQTQLDLNFCARDKWQIADDELNRLWRILKPRADAAGWGGRLLTEQRAWLRTRDARCEAEQAQYAGGSIAPQIYWSCMEQMTLRRNADFRSMM